MMILSVILEISCTLETPVCQSQVKILEGRLFYCDHKKKMEYKMIFQYNK